jgi:GcrA cell cycle regulator
VAANASGAPVADAPRPPASAKDAKAPDEHASERPTAAPAVARPAPRPVAAPVGKAAKSGRVTLLDLNDRICRWPIGHPDEPDFHFCGKPVSPGFPYCGEHCLLAYQAQMPRKDRPAGPPRPFGPNLPRPR